MDLTMLSLKNEFERRLAEAKQTVADPKQQNVTHRAAGFWLLLIGIAVTIGNYVLYTQNGRVWAILLAINLVLVVSGLIMLVSGKNPFARFRR